MNADSNTVTWHILGAGAIGSLWACYFRKSGFAVTLLTRNATPRSSINLLASETSENFTLDQVILPGTETLRIQQLLVCTKAQDTAAALRSIQRHLEAGAEVIVLQNGICNPPAAELLPAQSVFTAITGDGAYLTDTGDVVHAGRGETWIGCQPSLLAKLPTDNLNIRCCDDIAFRQWKKLAINAAVNGLTAIHQCRNGKLLDNAEALHSIDLICAEVATLSAKQNINLGFDALRTSVQQTLRDTANNFSSTYQDIANHRPTEIDAINGYLCELAKQLQIDCPENRRILQQVKQLETL